MYIQTSICLSRICLFIQHLTVNPLSCLCSQHLSVYTAIYLLYSICLFMQFLTFNSPVCLCSQLFVCLYIHLSVYPTSGCQISIHLLLIHQSVFLASCLSVYPEIYLLIQKSICLSCICLFIQHQSVNPLIGHFSRLFVCLSSHLSVYPASVCPFSIWLQIHQSVVAASCLSVYSAI